MIKSFHYTRNELKIKGFIRRRNAVHVFADEMLFMDGFDSDQFRGLLDGLRRNSIPVALKAVVTEQNLTWSVAELYAALLEEHKRLSQYGM